LRQRQRQPGLPEPVTAAYAAAATAHARLIIALNDQIAVMEAEVKAHFLAHPDAEIYLSMPGIGEITGARVLTEFEDDPTRYASAKARKNYAVTSPVTRASGKSHPPGPLRPQQPARQRPSASGILRSQILPWRAPLLRQTTSP
jgi:transposase